MALARVICRKINTFSSAVFARCGPGKQKSEDAFLTTSHAIAVADGVGGWTLQGVDPSLYSNELLSNFEKEADKAGVQIKTALVSAAKHTKAIGSSTFTGMLLHEKKPMIYSANIGDSGFKILRLNSKG
jgi:protein phosphatase PTC7